MTYELGFVVFFVCLFFHEKTKYISVVYVFVTKLNIKGLDTAGRFAFFPRETTFTIPDCFLVYQDPTKMLSIRKRKNFSLKRSILFPFKKKKKKKNCFTENRQKQF